MKNTSEGPYCPYCTNARREWESDRETFDIYEHVQRCHPSSEPAPTIAELTGSDPDFTGEMSTEEYVRWMRE